MKKLICLPITLLLLTSCGKSEIDPQVQRNNYEACQVNLISKVEQNEYNENKNFYDAQAKKICLPLLELDAEGSKKFVPAELKKAKKTNSSNFEIVEVSITHGPWTILDPKSFNSTSAREACTGDFFSYPYKEKINIYNEKSVLIATGSISDYYGYQNNFTNGENNLICKFTSKVKLNRNGNYFRVNIAGTWWNSLTDISTLQQNGWKISLNSDDY
jgi:hypothetical protein